MNNNYGTNTKPGTMGVASSREVLLSSRESRESQRNSNWYLKFIPPNHRLVRNELRQEVQCGIHSERSVCDSVSLIQEPPKSLQQEDVRPVLPLQADQV